MGEVNEKRNSIFCHEIPRIELLDDLVLEYAEEEKTTPENARCRYLHAQHARIAHL